MSLGKKTPNGKHWTMQRLMWMGAGVSILCCSQRLSAMRPSFHGSEWLYVNVKFSLKRPFENAGVKPSLLERMWKSNEGILKAWRPGSSDKVHILFLLNEWFTIWVALGKTRQSRDSPFLISECLHRANVGLTTRLKICSCFAIAVLSEKEFYEPYCHIRCAIVSQFAQDKAEFRNRHFSTYSSCSLGC